MRGLAGASVNEPGAEEKLQNPYYLAFDHLLAKLLAADQALNVSEAAFGYATESPDVWLGGVRNWHRNANSRPRNDGMYRVPRICSTLCPTWSCDCLRLRMVV